MIHILLLPLLIAFNVAAGTQVSLLVSVSSTSRILFRNDDTTKRLVDHFRKYYAGIELPLQIVANANQEDLHRELMNPENEAVFWVSHANSFDQGQGIGNEDVIIDVEGNNVKDLFQRIHPTIRFVAVLGCRTAPIIEEFRKKGYYEQNENLTLYARDKKIEGRKEMKKALDSFKNLSKSGISSCPRREGYALKISRTIGKGPAKSIKIMNRDKFLGIFPKGLSGETQKLKVYVSPPKSVHDLKLLIDLGERANNVVDYDKLTIESDAFRGEWNVFSDSNGTPIGLGQNIYRFNGLSAPISAPEIYLPYQCE